MRNEWDNIYERALQSAECPLVPLTQEWMIELAKGVGSVLMGKDAQLRSWTSVGLLAPPYTGHVTLDQVLDHSEPQFSQQQNGLVLISQDWRVDWEQCVCMPCPGNGPEGKLHNWQLLFFESDHGGHRIRWVLRPALVKVLSRQCCRCG